MLLEYLGKKPGVHITFSWMKVAVMMVPKKGFEVDDDDAKRLIADHPEIFRPYQESDLDKFIAANTVQESFDVDVPPVASDKEPTEEAPPEASGATADKYDNVEFDEKDGKYLCPFCDQSYSIHKGRGKYYLIKHLETEHAEQWATALAEKAGEEEPVDWS
jgi:hypothetical protein